MHGNKNYKKFENVNFRVSRVRLEDGSTELYFEGVGDWDDFEALLTLLHTENNCEILSNEEIIYIRVAELSMNGIKFKLMQDDMLGNYLLTEDETIVPILEEVANKVIDSIKQKLRSKGFVIKD